MSRKVKFNGVVHSFPDDATDDEITQTLNEKDVGGGFADPTKGLSGPASIDSKKLIQPVNTTTGNRMDQREQDITKGMQEQQDKGRGDRENLLPAIGGMTGGVPGALVGALVKQAIQKKDPTPMSAAQDVTTDTALQAIAPLIARGGNAIVRGFTKGVAATSPSIQNLAKNERNAQEIADVTKRNNVENTRVSISNIMNENRVKGGNAAREQVAADANRVAKEEFEAAQYDRKANIDYFTKQTSKHLADETDIMKEIATKAPKPALEPYKSGKIKGPKLPDEATSLHEDLYDAANGKIPFTKVADRAFSNTEDLRQLKLIDPQGTENLALSRAVSKGFNGAKVNPDKILTELDSNIYREALNPETHGSLKSLMTALKEQQELTIPKPDKILPMGEKLKYTPEKFKPEVPKLEPVNNSLLSLSKGRLVLAAPIAAAHLMGIPVTHAVTSVMSGIVLTEASIALLVKNPAIAKLAVAATKMPIDSPASGLLHKALLMGIRGGTALMQDSDGNDTKAIIGKDGKPQLPH